MVCYGTPIKHTCGWIKVTWLFVFCEERTRNTVAGEEVKVGGVKMITGSSPLPRTPCHTLLDSVSGDKSVQFVESSVHRAAICFPHDHGPRLFPTPVTPSQLGVLRPELQAARCHQVTMLHHCYRFASVRDLFRRRDGPGKWRRGQSVSRTCCGGFRVKVGWSHWATGDFVALDL
jgi:hypothetical protein